MRETLIGLSVGIVVTVLLIPLPVLLIGGDTSEIGTPLLVLGLPIVLAGTCAGVVLRLMRHKGTREFRVGLIVGVVATLALMPGVWLLTSGIASAIGTTLLIVGVPVTLTCTCTGFLVGVMRRRGRPTGPPR